MMSNKVYRVLLIEDNPGDVRLLEELLAGAQDSDFTIQSVSRLGEALRRIEQAEFDIVLLDLALPDGIGFETFKTLHEHLPGLPIIVVTATADESLAIQALQMGAQDYLVKGQIDKNILVRAIRYGVERNRLLKELQQEYNRKLEQQEREQRSLERMSNMARATVTAQMFGVISVRDSLPVLFNELVERYQKILDLVLEERAFKVDHNLSDELRALAELLGQVKAGPRDVIEIHSTALKAKTQDGPRPKAQAYVEEGRLLVLELMGYLVSTYRNYSLGLKLPASSSQVRKQGQQTHKGNDNE